MMKIVAISDLHGQLPTIPQCDLLLIGGDICPVHNHLPSYQEFWLTTAFRRWLASVPATKIIATWGNHDFIGQSPSFDITLPWTLLVDQATEFNGLKIYGSPWQPVFHDWAFNLTEPELERKWAAIPDDTEVLLLHGPPRGYGDLAPRLLTDDNEETWPCGVHTGSRSLELRLWGLKRLKLCVFGHIHEGRGRWVHPETWAILLNATLLDGRYQMVHEPWEVEL